MSFDTAFATFGIPGLVVFGFGAVAYKLWQRYIFSIASYDFLHKYNPHETLWETWENGKSVKDDHYHNDGAGKYAVKTTENGKPIWKINIPSGERGDVFIYTCNHEKPNGLDKQKYFFHVKIKNYNSRVKMHYQKKCFYGKRDEYIFANEKSISEERIIGDGVHIWSPVCYIGDEEGDTEQRKIITKEQLGIHISQIKDEGEPDRYMSIVDLIIEEAYIDKKCWRINLLPYFSNKYYLIIEPRKVETS